MTDELQHWFTRCVAAAPFAQQSVLDPQGVLFGDLTSLHPAAFDGLVRLWSRPRSRLGRRGVLILGEMGSGKTHLLARLAQYAKRRLSLTWATVTPETEAAQDLRRALLDALLRAAPGEVSPIDHLLRQAGQSLSSLGYQGDSSVPIPPSVWLGLEALRHPDQRLAALRWLRGQSLGKVADPLTARLGEPAEALAVVVALTRLLAIHHGLANGLLLAFDGLDGLADSALQRLDALLTLIESQVPMACVAVFATPTTWRQRCRQVVPSPRLLWLEQQVFELDPCRADQVIPLIRARLQAVIGVEPDDLYPLEEAWLRQQGDGMTPRRVLQIAHQAVGDAVQWQTTQPQRPHGDAIHQLHQALVARQRHFLANPEGQPPSDDVLSLAMTLFMESQAPHATVKRDGHCIYLWRADGSPWLLVFIDHAHYHSAVNTHLQKALQHQEDYWQVVYVRDGRWPIPQRWKASQELLTRLTDSGAQVAMLSLEAAADWYALAHLDQAVAEGEVTVPSEGEPRPITHQEFSRFVALLGDSSSGFSRLHELIQGVPSPLPPPPETAFPVLVELLRVAPGGALLLNQLANQLAHLPAEALSNALKHEAFAHLESRDGPVILLRKIDWEL